MKYIQFIIVELTKSKKYKNTLTFMSLMKTDVLIIGGGPAGIVTAVTAKQNYPEKKIVVVRREKRVVVPCGIPYIFGTLRDAEKNIIPDSVLTSKGIDILVDEIEDVDIEKKVAKSKSHRESESI